MFSVQFCLLSLISLNLINRVTSEINKTNSGLVQSQCSDETFKNRYEFIRINHRNIPTITWSLFENLQPTRRLEIEYCNVLSIVDEAFRSFGNLDKLSLKHNKLSRIGKNTFHGVSIEELDLSDNEIRDIAYTAFASQPTLRKISLKNNKLYILKPWIWYTNNLCDINLEHNNIQVLIFPIFGKKDILCDVNLILSNNGLEEIYEEAFANIKFNRLYLDHNNITHLGRSTFLMARSIKELRLDHNNITCAVPLDTVKKYNVQQNPWNSTC